VAPRAIPKVKEKADFASKIQIASTDRSTESTHADVNGVFRRQLERQVQTTTVPTSTNSMDVAIQCDLMTTTTRNKETTAFVKTSENTGRVRRRRRKQRKKKQRPNQPD